MQAVRAKCPAKMRLDQRARLGLKSQTAVVAGPDPGRLDGLARGREAAAKPLVDLTVLPDRVMGRLAMVRGKDPLRVRPGQMAGIGQRSFRLRALRRYSRTGAPDHRSPQAVRPRKIAKVKGFDTVALGIGDKAADCGAKHQIVTRTHVVTQGYAGPVQTFRRAQRQQVAQQVQHDHVKRPRQVFDGCEFEAVQLPGCLLNIDAGVKQPKGG
jgi:hypothetical protein